MKTAGLVTIMTLVAAMGLPDDTRRVDDIVAKIQARVDSTEDLTATVHQELVVASTGRILTAQGTVAFKRPGKMRWSLHNSEAHVIVADGATLWFYQPEEQQVLKAPFRAAFRSTTPVSFLTGVGRIGEDFEVSLAGTEAGHVKLLLLPREGEAVADVGRLVLTVEMESYGIVGAEIHDPLGNVTRLRFSELRRNTGIEDAHFRFAIPPGVDVIEAPIGY